MTSSPPDRPPVYLEFPNFGYGPASTALALISGFENRYSWHVVSTGGAADFVMRQLDSATWHDLDTFNAACWPRFLDLAPVGSLLVSCSNPPFAAWAIDQGYRVGIVDTLDWMWASPPGELSNAEFYLVQAYFGPSVACDRLRRETIRPIVDRTLWFRSRIEPGRTLIGFGGMHVPGGEDLVAEYVHWFLAGALPVLVEQPGASRIEIVGGRSDLAELVPGTWASHKTVHVREGLDRTTYAVAARTAEHLIISPGLASLYECAAAGLSPLIQPGFSMSMILQARQVARTGYAKICSWPWLAEVAEDLASMPETEGTRHVTGRIRDTIQHEDPHSITVSEAVTDHLSRGASRPRLSVAADPGLPDGAALLESHLRRLT